MTCALYCVKEKTDIEGVTAHLQLNKSKLVSLLDLSFGLLLYSGGEEVGGI